MLFQVIFVLEARTCSMNSFQLEKKMKAKTNEVGLIIYL